MIRFNIRFIIKSSDVNFFDIVLVLLYTGSAYTVPGLDLGVSFGGDNGSL